MFDGGQANLYVYCGDDPINCIDPSGLDWQGDLADFIDENGIDDFAAGMGDALTGVPFTSYSLTALARDAGGIGGSVDICSNAYFGGQVAGAVVQSLNGHPKLPGWLFGKGTKAGPGGLLNRNGFARLGWGWKGKSSTGNFVFRGSLGSGKGHPHLDIFNYPRNWPGGF